MPVGKWDALVLAAGRGADDPLARAQGVSHKCLLTVAGQPMLSRVIGALAGSGRFERIAVSIEDPDLLQSLPPAQAVAMEFIPSASSAAASVAAALEGRDMLRPVLVTTGDHPLLTPEILEYFLARSEQVNCDLAVGLALAETILAAHPGTRRTFLKFGRTRVSGCNLYAFRGRASLKALAHWQFVERHRKQPWRLVSSFGAIPLLANLVGLLSLDGAFRWASNILGLEARPILMPFADAAIDVDKPSDLELVERILKAR
ncbi:MAG: NTP transferase domain-containing protein [Pseudomonadota bacterium]|nr:NTP transferase domain-containing protein [Pseudomonadota bacterium]